MCIGMTELKKQSFGVKQVFCNDTKKETEFFKFFRTPIFIEHPRWLLLELIEPIST